MSRFGDLLSGNVTSASSVSTPEPVIELVVTEPVVQISIDEILGEESEVVEEESEESEEAEEESGGEPDLSFYDMSKRELETYARTLGLELDRRHSKSALIRELTDYLAN